MLRTRIFNDLPVNDDISNKTEAQEKMTDGRAPVASRRLFSTTRHILRLRRWLMAGRNKRGYALNVAERRRSHEAHKDALAKVHDHEAPLVEPFRIRPQPSR